MDKIKKPKGLLDGVMDFLKMLEEMEKKGLTEKTFSREQQTANGNAKYGYNVRIGFLNPTRQPLGSKANTMPWKSKRAVRVTEFREKEELIGIEEKNGFTIITVELPTLDEKAVNCTIKENKLKISANAFGGTVEKEIAVPKKNEITKTAFKNGVLEIWLKKKKKEEK
ncbi:MAG: gas vesicle protein GvpH [Candidatus Micrarchaeota archaeon]